MLRELDSIGYVVGLLLSSDTFYVLFHLRFEIYKVAYLFGSLLPLDGASGTALKKLHIVC